MEETAIRFAVADFASLGPEWTFVDRPKPDVDGHGGAASVTLSESQAALLERLAARTASHTDEDPKTGAELGAGAAPAKAHRPGNGRKRH